MIRYGLNEDTIKTIGEFSILWCQFERFFFDSNANPHKIVEWADSYKVDKNLQDCCDAVRCASVEYMKDIGMENVIDRVYSDRNRGNDESKKLIYNFLNKKEGDSIFKSCILYIYRIRNNLFHGLKSVESLKEQKEMFEAINEILNSILKKMDFNDL